MISKNVERFGKDRIQKLRDKNAAFQAAKKKGSGYSMDDFVKDFPNSNTAKQRAKRNRIPSVKKMNPIEKKNRARMGDARVDALKAKNADFKLMRKGQMSKDDFIKKYPKSITAQRSKGLRDHTEWDAFNIVSNYLIDSNQVDNMDEALYVMTEMDAQTIQGIVEDFKKLSK